MATIACASPPMTAPQFDNQGNPNFDTHGNYQGPHGLGKLVTPDDNPDLNPALRSDGDDSDDSY